MPREPQASGTETLSLIGRVLEAAEADPVFRDLYLQRARALLAPLLSYSEHLRFEREKVLMDGWLRQSRAAVERRDWTKVQELVGQMRALRQEREEKRGLLEVGERVYEAEPAVLDPFSPGFPSLFQVSEHALEDLRKRLVECLAALEKEDPLRQEFYASRRAYFQNLSLTSLEPAQAPGRLSPDRVQREALRALDRGDMDRLENILQQVLDPQIPSQMVPPLRQAVSAAKLALYFPEEARVRAQKFGLVAVRVEANEAFHDYLGCCCVWRMTFPDRPLTEGGKPMKGCTCGHACPPSIPEALRENLDLLMVHPFVNSAGVRYLPRFAAEGVLVEGFSEGEGEVSGSNLLQALGLKRRSALSRLEVERALLEHGPKVLEEELGLSPQEFRLVCIPFDLYCRLGLERGWGQRRLWTHFDGYQVLEGGRLRALVGGDVRYGGVYDLCSIDRVDEREGVVVRFAVVQRQRLVVG